MRHFEIIVRHIRETKDNPTVFRINSVNFVKNAEHSKSEVELVDMGRIQSWSGSQLNCGKIQTS